MLEYKMYNTKIKQLALMISLCSAVVLPKLSHAYIERNDSKGYYFKIGVGSNKASSPRNYYKKNIGTSRSFNIGFGGNLISNNRLELNYSKRGGFKYTGQSNNKLMSENVSAAIKSETLMLNIYSDQYVTEEFTPYFGFGLGYTKNKLNLTKTTLIHKKSVTKDKNLTKIAFAWQAVLGANFAVHKNILFDISYRYSQLGKLPAPVTHIGSKSGSKLKNQEVLFSILFKI